MDIVILGCGFTGERVARRFLARGAQVTGTTRDPQRLSDLGAKVVRIEDLRVPKGALVLHSIPPNGPARLFETLGDAPARLVYISTTGVYGSAQVVDESTPAAPERPEHWARIEVEQRVATGPWSALTLRPAAIYGPGRGMQESIRTGRCRLGDNLVSRIHVDDLAAHAEAALLSDITGAYPVADEEPCSATEIAEFCAKLLGIPMPATSAAPRFGKPSNRRVDGSAVRRLLGVTLRYPSYRAGIPASLYAAPSASSSPAVK